jgi:hypothetical protein
LDGLWLIVASCAVAVAGERHYCSHRWPTSLSCGLLLLLSRLGWVQRSFFLSVGVDLHGACWRIISHSGLALLGYWLSRMLHSCASARCGSSGKGFRRPILLLFVISMRQVLCAPVLAIGIGRHCSSFRSAGLGIPVDPCGYCCCFSLWSRGPRLSGVVVGSIS